MVNLDPNLIYESNTISSAYPWLLALEIIKKMPEEDLGGYEYIVANNEDFLWEDDNANKLTFKKFPFAISSLPLQSDGKIPSVSLTLFNTATLAKFMEEKRCFIGYDIILYFVNEKALTKKEGDDIVFIYNTKNYPIKFPLVVKDGEISKQITLQLGGPSYLNIPVPSQLYYRDFCRFSYRSEFCYMNVVPEDKLIVDPDKNIDDTVCNKSYERCVELRERYNQYVWSEKTFKGVSHGGFPMLNKGSLIL